MIKYKKSYHILLQFIFDIKQIYMLHALIAASRYELQFKMFNFEI